MTYIDLRKLELPEGWENRATAAYEAVKKADPGARAAIIDSYASVWKELRSSMRKLSNRKCWYSEAPQSGADQDVDHYRPKGRVAECPAHAGYWWLAFRVSNLRLSCTYCNQRRVDQDAGTSGGKLDHFPIQDEADRVLDESRAFRLTREFPLLLDPCRRSDIGLLWFNEDGMPTVRDGLPGAQKLRVAETNKLLHLDHESFVTGRRMQQDLAKDLLMQGCRAFNEYVDGDSTKAQCVEDAIESLEKLAHWTKPYSSAVKCLIKGERSLEQPWIEEIRLN